VQQAVTLKPGSHVQAAVPTPILKPTGPIPAPIEEEKVKFLQLLNDTVDAALDLVKACGEAEGSK